MSRIVGALVVLVQGLAVAAGGDERQDAQWNQPGTPMYYVIDHEGVMRHKWFGSPGEKAIDAALDKLMEEAEGARRTAGADEPIDSVYTGSPQPHECRQ